MSDKIEGVPEGWRLVAIRRVKNGEWFIERSGRIELWREPDDETSCWVHPIIEKIEQPKQYRPFANAAEFEPHRDRWWRFKKESNEFFRTYYYSDKSHMGHNWHESFAQKVFDDGTPFGVEVTE
jgi:hypothetical protein